ncbi:MAG: hypothetical protein ACFFE4_01600 [Candidatus Thorarchaeota archaeon]
MFDILGEGVEFLLALGSVIGVLGFIVGIIGWLTLGQFNKRKMISVIFFSIVLLAVCGTYTGFKYFHINY